MTAISHITVSNVTELWKLSLTKCHYITTSSRIS